MNSPSNLGKAYEKAQKPPMFKCVKVQYNISSAVTLCKLMSSGVTVCLLNLGGTLSSCEGKV